MQGEIHFKIKRQDGPDKPSYWEEFKMPYERGHNVVSALMYLRENPVNAKGQRVQPVVWDSNCMEEVCGACTMSINGTVRQACAALIDGFDDPADDLSVSPGPNALVLFNPALDIEGVERRIERFGGIERARALSPLANVKPGAPPTLVMQGTADDTTLPEKAVRFTDVMRAAGVRCDLRLYEGEGHGFFNWFDGNNPFFTETMRDTDVFLASLGYTSGEPTIDDFVYEGAAA